ncbi:hypothetical protein A0J61_04557 [Choanephora cucurbitarum]|uniref:Uncharacterized protein n=1 Tax=Choanephora cucurbitarum TaxID=101091 RepID=A0A1C7NF64_9FUNG|nr:hypothetical protein A0J61_04557 [Choanephora cucurbitarum]
MSKQKIDDLKNQLDLLTEDNKNLDHEIEMAQKRLSSITDEHKQKLDQVTQLPNLIEQAKEKSKELEEIKGQTETLMSAVEELEANDSLSKKEVEQVYIKRREKQDKELASIQAELDESLNRAKELEAKVANKPSE